MREIQNIFFFSFLIDLTDNGLFRIITAMQSVTIAHE